MIFLTNISAYADINMEPFMNIDKDQTRSAVREGYAKVARRGVSCCGTGNPQELADSSKKISKSVGYSEEEMASVPEGANLGLGCGNPVAIASIKEGDVVLDLGSGAGFDAFLAAKKVGLRGRVIGVDMTAEMIDRARANARKSGLTNVEFRLGEIENLPVPDAQVDLIISNCVINLSTNKPRVFEEAFRTLKPGGRLMVSDIVLMKELPPRVRASVEAYVGCLAGASLKEEYLGYIRQAGFSDIRVVSENHYPVEDMLNDPTAKVLIRDLSLTPEDLRSVEKAVVSIRIQAVKLVNTFAHGTKCCA